MIKGGIVGKVYEFVNRFVPVIENKSTNTYLYGADDLLPNNNLRMINDCGVAKRCIRKKARYIQGDGFSDEINAKFQVNSTQTADGLLAHISSYAAYNEGFALQITRSADLKIVDVKCIPFECVRNKSDGTLIYNPTKGQVDYKQDKDVVHPAFNPRITAIEYVANLDKYKAQPEIFYVYEQTADNPYYPVPDYNAGIEDIQTCIEISLVDLECVLNGFIISGIFTTQEIDNVNKGEDNLTPLEAFQKELRTFTGKRGVDKVKNPDGSYTRNDPDYYSNKRTNRYSLLHMMVATMAEAPRLQMYDPKPILEASNTKRDIIARAVCMLIGVHPVLIGFSDSAILGNQQAFANIITELNNEVNSTQRMISDAMTVLYPGKDWSIQQFNPIRFIPAEVWAKMTDDEIRNTIGLDPIESTTPTHEQAVLDTLNSLSPLLSAEIVRRMDTAQLMKLIGLQATPPVTTTPQPATNGTN